MQKPEFKSLLEEHIVPMFPGSVIENESDSVKSSQKRAMQLDPQRIKVRWDNNQNFQFNLRRSQQFSQNDAAFVNSVIKNLNEVAPIETTPYFSEMIGATIRRSVAAHSAPNFTESADRVLRELEQWSEETYEGRPISATFGLKPGVGNPGPISLSDFLQTPFSRVATSSLDAIVTFTGDGIFAGYETLSPAAKKNTIMAPQRFASIADWTSDGKVALVLSRNGEILVFRNGDLAFARRRGRWRKFDHTALITRIGLNRALVPQLRTAVYLSCLDVSFAKVGGGIGLIASSKRSALAKDNRVNADDSLNGASDKAKFLQATIAGKKFQDLDRPLRQTLLAMDGSTVIERDGTVIAVGAIIKVEAGSKTGGGRKAAAMIFGKYGLGIKISSDGEIVGFNAVGPTQEPFFAFG